MILDRHEAIKARQDPFGKVWGIRTLDKELAFWIVCHKNAAGDLVMPDRYPSDNMVGKWTRQAAALAEISTYLEDAWNYAEEEQKRQVRKDYKEKVEKKEARAAVG